MKTDQASANVKSDSSFLFFVSIYVFKIQNNRVLVAFVSAFSICNWLIYINSEDE